MVQVEVAMKVLFYKLLRKRMVPVDDYRNKLIDRYMADSRSKTLPLWEYIRQEFNIDPVYSWREKKNYLKFNNEKDYMMFLLKI